MRLAAPVWLLLAVAAGLALAAYHYQHELTLVEARATALGRQLAEARADLKESHAKLSRLEASTVELDTQLGSAKSLGTATEVKSSQLQRELGATQAVLTEREQRLVAVLAELEEMRRKFTSQGATPPPVPDALDTKRMAELEVRLTELLTRELERPVAQSAAPSRPAGPATAAPAPQPQVVRLGSRDAFAVLNCGTDQGVMVGLEASLIRGTHVVARVQISDARSRYSVARILPCTQKGQLQTGDIVVLAR